MQEDYAIASISQPKSVANDAIASDRDGGDGFLRRLLHLKGDEKDADFARRCGIPYTTLKRYLGGSLPGIDAAVKIADANDVTVDWLAGRKAPAREGPVLAPQGSVIVPRYETQASAGGGALVISENISEYMTVGRDWLRKNLPSWAPPNAIVGVLEGSGDSMWPTIHDGDLIMVVQDVERRIVERGGIFVFSLDDRLLLKRLQVLASGDLRILSDNKAYEAETIPAAELDQRLIVHGQVFFVGGKPRGLE